MKVILLCYQDAHVFTCAFGCETEGHHAGLDLVLCCFSGLSHIMCLRLWLFLAQFDASFDPPKLPVLGSGILPSFSVSHGPQWSCEVFQPSQGKF